MTPIPSQISAPIVAERRTTCNDSGHMKSQKRNSSFTSSVFCTMKMTSRAAPLIAAMVPPPSLTPGLLPVATRVGCSDRQQADQSSEPPPISGLPYRGSNVAEPY